MFWQYLYELYIVLKIVVGIGTATSTIIIIFVVTFIVMDNIKYEDIDNTKRIFSVVVIFIFIICTPLCVLLPSKELALKILMHLGGN